MIQTVLLLMAVVGADHDLLGSSSASKATKTVAVKSKPKSKSEPKWPPVCINVLGFKGCKYCADMQPAIGKLKKEGLHVYYWDIDKRPKFAAQFKARGMYPHVALMIDGVIVQQHDGSLCEEKLRHLYVRGANVRAGKGKLDPSKRYTVSR